MRAAKVLAPAFGTYALAALASHGIAPWLGKHIGGKMGKWRMEEERENKQ